MKTCIPYLASFSSSFLSAQSPSGEEDTESIGRVNSRRTQCLFLSSNATPSGLRLQKEVIFTSVRTMPCRAWKSVTSAFRLFKVCFFVYMSFKKKIVFICRIKKIYVFICRIKKIYVFICRIKKINVFICRKKKIMCLYVI